MRTRTLAAGLSAVALASVLAACGQAGSSGTHPTSSANGSNASVATCAPVADDQLVVLEDDKKLQNADNVIPALNAKAVAGDDAIIPLLDTVSAALDTPGLIALNKAVDVDRQTSVQAAKDFVDQHDLAAKDTSAGKGTKVTIGAANFSESATLANIYADVLKSAGYAPTVRDVGSRETYLKALENGQLTIVPEYTSTLTTFINAAQNGADAKSPASGDLDKTVAALTDLGKQVGLVFGKPSAAQDQNAYAVTTAFADKNGVKTLSDLAAKCGGLILGGPPECTTRDYCQPGLEKVYGLQFASFKQLDTGGPLTKAALQKGQISLGLVFSSDGQLAATS